ncbi:uncharacterized protein [Macrobrachium rosenbergii]|uniref:uncharacterized protein n=1 Tax=Macrobrachium rosenbergii TaxID=79674 RepID=UPI0034D57683
MDFPTPKNKKQICSFLGMVGFFWRFVKGFSTLSSPLMDVLRNVQFLLGERQQLAFQKIKETLMSPQVMKFPDFEQPFTLVTNASHEGIGACLMQKLEDKLHCIPFYSRKFKTRGNDELSLSRTDKEAFGVVSSLVHFKMLLGNKVEVLTDHKPLLDLFNKLDLSPTRASWFLTIRYFDAKLRYTEGRHNVVADALRRSFYDSDGSCVCYVSGDCIDWDISLLDAKQDEDEILADTKAFLRWELGRKGYRLPFAGLELEGNLLVRKIKYKLRSSEDKGDTTQIVVPKSLVHVVLVIVHCRFGSPHLENGRKFVNKTLECLAEVMGIQKVTIIPYRPEANGLCEQVNRKVIEALRVTVRANDVNWDRYIAQEHRLLGCELSLVHNQTPADSDFTTFPLEFKWPLRRLSRQFFVQAAKSLPDAIVHQIPSG